jgi:hypothetical protein
MMEGRTIPTIGLVLVLTGIIGCFVWTTSAGLEPVAEGPKPEIAKLPTIELEGTIVSLSFIPIRECEEDCPSGYVYPPRFDEGVIRVDRIIAIDNPYGWELEGFRVGNEIQVEFEFSARPAKIRYMLARKSTPSSDISTASHGLPAAIPMEDGYLIFTVETTLVSKETDVILPGLEVGVTFRAKIDYRSAYKGVIGKYIIIN